MISDLALIPNNIIVCFTKKILRYHILYIEHSQYTCMVGPADSIIFSENKSLKQFKNETVLDA